VDALITVRKYPLELIDLQTLDMPEGAQLLAVQVQHERPMLWAKVDTDKPSNQRLIRLVGTGNPMPDTHLGPYLDTIQMHGGRLVLHAFEG
jgi:hypothetical protein